MLRTSIAGATLQRRLLQTYRSLAGRSETYYDILNVRRDCSDKEIRNAFLKLSKKFHPDVKGAAPDPQQTAQFVRISEAYQTLSKPRLRRDYDQHLSACHSMRTYKMGNHVQADIFRPWQLRPDVDPNPGAYYGIKGFERISNAKIASMLLVLGIFSAVFGFVSVKHSFALNQQRLDEISAEANQHYQAVRADAARYGKEEQLRRMIERMQRQAEKKYK